MKKILSVLVLLLSFSLGSMSQLSVKGVILDASTGEPLPFTNLGVLGTNAGCASDIDGKYELNVPSSYAEKFVKVTAIGYKSYEIKVSDAVAKGFMTISLSPVAYGIEEVNVIGKSQVLMKLIKDVVAAIPTNYIASAHSYKAYYKADVTANNEPIFEKEAVVTIYDEMGYGRRSAESDFASLNYNISQVRRGKNMKSVASGFVSLDDILTVNVVRNTKNVLDVANLDCFDLKDGGKLSNDGHDIQVIKYVVNKPSLYLVGDAYATAVSGELYVDVNDKAVVKNIVHLSGKINPSGRSLMAPDSELGVAAKTTLTCTYVKVGSKYVLSGLLNQVSYTKDGSNVNKEEILVTTKFNKTNPEKIQGRTYYEDVKANASFWNSYSTYFDGEEQ